jgi:hypothetical protein
MTIALKIILMEDLLGICISKQNIVSWQGCQYHFIPGKAILVYKKKALCYIPGKRKILENLGKFPESGQAEGRF